MEDVPKITTSPLSNIRESRRSGRIVKTPDRFKFLGETIFYKHDLDPSSYNEAISDKTMGNWEIALKVEDGHLYDKTRRFYS